MPELRWILLLIGVLFLAVLAWREARRPQRADEAPEGPDEGAAAHAEHERPHALREPTFTLPEIRPPERSAQLPVLEVADESVLGLRIEGADIDERVGERDVSAPREIPVVAAAPDVAPAAQPVVDWPPDGERRILALRLVSSSGERFAGRSVRLALAAEGFVSGRFSIYHKAAADGRAVVSAASLNKPGTFDPELMDAQRFAGLNLFAVLPGPLAAPDAFDELLSSARNLNDRLSGALQDAWGEPLTQERIAALRGELAA